MRLENQLLALAHLLVQGQPQLILMLVGKLHLHLPLLLLVLLQPPMLLVNLPARMLREDAFATASSDASIKWSKTPRKKLVTIPFGS